MRIGKVTRDKTTQLTGDDVAEYLNNMIMEHTLPPYKHFWEVLFYGFEVQRTQEIMIALHGIAMKKHWIDVVMLLVWCRVFRDMLAVMDYDDDVFFFLPPVKDPDELAYIRRLAYAILLTMAAQKNLEDPTQAQMEDMMLHIGFIADCVPDQKQIH